MSGSTRILIIEDDREVRESLTAYLEDSDFEMIEAQDGREGLEAFRSRTPDLILCDLRMPEVDGLDVLKAVTSESPDTPILVVSGTGDLTDAVNALKLGAWDYVTKPIHDLAVLEHAIRKALEQAELRRENRRYRRHLEEVNRELTTSLQQLEEDEAAGRRVQFQLLPPRHQAFGDLEFSRTLLPSTFLSGDFLDYFSIDDAHVGFYVIDVSGHGVSSAFVTVLVKAYFSQCLEVYRRDRGQVILRPADMLTRLNDYVLRQQLDKHLTIFYGVIDRVRNRLSYCNGAQFPYPIFYDGREARYLEEHGPAIGLFEFSDFKTCEIDLPEGFCLTIVSDGVLEILDTQGLSSKEARLLPLLAGNHRTIPGLEKELGLTEDRELPDDVTFLMVKRR